VVALSVWIEEVITTVGNQSWRQTHENSRQRIEDVVRKNEVTFWFLYVKQACIFLFFEQSF
jgi:hypothetical protein